MGTKKILLAAAVERRLPAGQSRPDVLQDDLVASNGHGHMVLMLSR
jgi:hypothetical protein